MSTGEKIKELQRELDDIKEVCGHNFRLFQEAFSEIDRRRVADQISLRNIAFHAGISDDDMQRFAAEANAGSYIVFGIGQAMIALRESGLGYVPPVRLAYDRDREDPDTEIFGDELPAGAPASTLATMAKPILRTHRMTTGSKLRNGSAVLFAGEPGGLRKMRCPKCQQIAHQQGEAVKGETRYSCPCGAQFRASSF